MNKKILSVLLSLSIVFLGQTPVLAEINQETATETMNATDIINDVNNTEITPQNTEKQQETTTQGEATTTEENNAENTSENPLSFDTKSLTTQDKGMIGDGISLSNFMNSSNIFDSQLFGNMNLGLTEQNSFSQMFANMTGLEVDDKQLIDASAFGGNLDSGLINMQYQSLLSDMQNVAASKPVTGEADNAAGLFTNTYGDLASKIQIDKAKIPKGFDTDKMLKSASKSINKAYSKNMKSSAFKTVKNKVSITSAFDKAKNAGNATVNSSMLANGSDLKSLTSSMTASNKSRISSESSKYVKAGNGITKAAKNNSDSYDDDTMKSISKDKKNVKSLEGKKAKTFGEGVIDTAKGIIDNSINAGKKAGNWVKGFFD